MGRRAPRGARVELGRRLTAGHAFVSILAAVVLLVLAAAGAAQAQQRQTKVSEADALLFEAVAANDLARVRAVIAEGADLNARDHAGRTAGEIAVDRGYFDIAHFLLAAQKTAQAREAPPPPPPVPTVAVQPQPSAPPARQIEKQPVSTATPTDAKKLWSGTIEVPGTPAPAENTQPSTAKAPPPTVASSAPARPAVQAEPARPSSPVLAVPTSPLPPAPPLTAARDAQWPSDQPNPFDPKTLAPGSLVPIVGEIRGPGSTPRVPAPPSSTDELGPTAAAAPPVAESPPIAPSSPEPTPIAAKPAEETPPKSSRPAPLSPSPAPPSTPASTDSPAPADGGFLKRLARFLALDDERQPTPPPQVSAEAKDVGPPEAEEQAAASIDETSPETPAPSADHVTTTAPSLSANPTTTADPPQNDAAEPPSGAESQVSAKVGPPPVARPSPAERSAETPAVAEEPEPAAVPVPSSGGFFAGLAAWVKGKPAANPPSAADSGNDADDIDKKKAAVAGTGTSTNSRATATQPSAPESVEPITPTMDAKAPAATSDGEATEAAAPPSVAATDKQPTDAPSAATAEADEKPGVVKRLFGRLSGLFGRQDANRPAEPDQAPTPQTASTPRQETSAAATAATRSILQGVDLALGNSVRLGRLFDAANPPVGGCIAKRAYDAIFCIEDVDWPSAVAPAFDVRSSLYAGVRAITRYDGGAASGVHAIFPTAAFAEVVDHFTTRYGPPNESANLMMAMIGEPRRPNPMVRWVAAADGKTVDILEVRTFDDSRGTLPNLRYGVVRLFREGAVSVFRHLSTGDLLVLHMRRIGQPRELDEEVDRPGSTPANPAPAAPAKPGKPTSDSGALAPAKNIVFDAATNTELILPAPTAPIAPAAPSLVASMSPVPPPSFPVPPRKPDFPSLATQKDGGEATDPESQDTGVDRPPETKVAGLKKGLGDPVTVAPSPASPNLPSRESPEPPARPDVPRSEEAGKTTIAGADSAPPAPAPRPTITEVDNGSSPPAAMNSPAKTTTGNPVAKPKAPPSPATRRAPVTPVVAPPPPPPLPEPAKEQVASTAAPEPPKESAAEDTTIRDDKAPAPESEADATPQAPKQKFWSRLSQFLKLEKEASTPDDPDKRRTEDGAAAKNGETSTQMAAAESEAEDEGEDKSVAKSADGPAAPPDEATDIQKPDPWAPKVTLTDETARTKGVDSIVSPVTPTALPLPPVQQDVAVSVDASSATPVDEPVMSPPPPAAADSPATTTTPSSENPERPAADSGKKDQVARSTGPRLPLIALPDRQFFSKLGAFLLRRKAEADRPSSSTAEAEKIAKSFSGADSDAPPADTTSPSSDARSDASPEPDSPIAVPAIAEPDDDAADSTEERDTARVIESPPPLPSLSERADSEPPSRAPLAIPPAIRTKTPEHRQAPAPAPPPASESERATATAARPDPEAEAIAVPDVAESDEESTEEEEESDEDSLFAREAEEDDEEEDEAAEGSLFAGEDDPEEKEDIAARGEDDDAASSEAETGEAGEGEKDTGPFAQVLGKWAEFFAGAGARSAVVVNQALDPVPEAAAAETSEQDRRGDGPWQVTDVQVAGLSTPGQGEPLQAFPPQAALAGVRLALGKSVRLGVLPLGRRDDPEFRRRCVEKKRRTVIFCVIPVDWPKTMKPYFTVGSVLYDGAKAIARYDDERATFYHALFESDAFEEVVAFYRKRLGLPTESWVRRMVVMASAPRPNPTVLWRSVESATNLVTTLEIRKYDDARGGFPDTKRGAILLYHTWSSPIFPEVSHLELMMVK